MNYEEIKSYAENERCFNISSKDEITVRELAAYLQHLIENEDKGDWLIVRDDYGDVYVDTASYVLDHKCIRLN